MKKSEKHNISTMKLVDKALELGCPIFSEAFFLTEIQTWLRDTYDIHCEAHVFTEDEFGTIPSKNEYESCTLFDWCSEEDEVEDYDPLYVFDTYKEALVEALYEGLLVLIDKLKEDE